MITRDAIVAEARSWIGTPYAHQQSSRGIGCDCLGLVRGVWRALYGGEPEPVPAYAATWRDGSGAETLLEAAARHLVAASGIRPGDVLIFRWRPHLPARHCAIATGPRRIVHAYEAAGWVAEGNLQAGWQRRIAGIFSFPGAT